jgi:competence protein ComEC
MILILVFFLVFAPVDLEKALMPWVKPVNELCLRLSPDTTYRSWYQAIVCGQNLPPSIEKKWFQQTGLIHVIVVSGSHLVFLEDLLALLKLPTGVRWLLLLLFSLASNLQPPIARAVIQRVWAEVLRRRQTPLPSLHMQLLAGISTLALFPSWWTSLSFFMSWICVLALSLPLPSKNPLWQSALIYLLMFPVASEVQTPHPSSILFNFVMAPVLGLCLFPLSLLGFFHPALALVSDFGWKALFFVFAIVPLPESESGTLFSAAWLVLYVIILQAGSFAWVIYLRRKMWNSLSY